MFKTKNGPSVWNAIFSQLYLVNQSNYASTLCQTPWRNCEENKPKVENMGILFAGLIIKCDRKIVCKDLKSSSNRISKQEVRAWHGVVSKSRNSVKDGCMFYESVVSILLENRERSFWIERGHSVWRIWN